MRFSFQFYAADVGSDPNRRTAFVRKRNPGKVLKRGGLVFAYGDRLREVEDPLMLLDDRFDLVVAEDGLAVLDQDVFERLFRDVEVIAERYPIYAKTFETLTLDEDQLGLLAERCRRDSRLGNRLRQIYESGHLAAGKVTMKQVRGEIDCLGLDTDRLMKDGKLDFTGADTGTILKLLNEDLFIGGLSKLAYEAGKQGSSPLRSVPREDSRLVRSSAAAEGLGPSGEWRSEVCPRCGSDPARERLPPGRFGGTRALCCSGGTDQLADAPRVAVGRVEALGSLDQAVQPAPERAQFGDATIDFRGSGPE